MFVKKKRNIGILSRATFEDAKLIDIIKEEDFNIVNDQINSYSKTYYVYKFKFNANLKKALKSNSVQARITLRSKAKKRKYTMFGDMKKTTPLGVTAAVLRKTDDNKRQISISDKKGIIYREFIDLRKYIDSFKINSFGKIPDKDMFGTQKKTVLVRAGSLQNRDADAIVHQRAIQFKSDGVSQNDFRENYVEALRAGVDSSTFFFATSDETPIDEVGTFVTPDISRGTKHEDNIMNAMRDSVSQNISNPPNNSVGEFKSSDLIAFMVDEPAIIREMEVVCKLIPNDIKNSTFSVNVDIVGERGIIGQTIRFDVDHQAMLSDFLSPDSFPKISCEKGEFPSNNTVFRFSEKNDPRITGWDVYVRVIRDTHALLDSRFYKVGTFPVTTVLSSPPSRNKIQSRGINFSSPGSLIKEVDNTITNPEDGSIYIFRVIGIGTSGKRYGNFNTSSIVAGNHISRHVTLSTRSITRGVEVVIKNVPGVFAAAYIMRKDLTCHQRTYEVVTKTITRDENEGGDKLSRYAGVGSLIKNYTVVDRNVMEGRIYQYTVGLVTQSGINMISSVSRIHNFIEPQGIVEILVSNISFSDKASQNSSRSHENVGSVSFDVEGKIKETDADKLVALLNDAGLQGYYDKGLESISSDFQNLISYTVYRDDLISGEMEYMGVFAGGTINDDGTNISPPKLGRKYSYRVMSALVSPEDAINELTYGAAQSEPVIASTALLRDPMALASIKSTVALNQDIASGGENAAASLSVMSLDKSYSSISLGTGTLSTGLALQENHRSSLLGVNITGDFVDFKVNTGIGEIEISPIGISRTGSGSNLIKWSIRKTGSSSYGLVDYFIIKAKKNERIYCAGTSFGESVQDGYRFIDSSNKKFIGKIEYLIQPVFYDGDIGPTTKLGTIIQEKETEALGYRG